MLGHIKDGLRLFLMVGVILFLVIAGLLWLSQDMLDKTETP